MQKQILVTKEYIVNYPEETIQTALAKAKKGTLEPTDLVTKVVIVEGGPSAKQTLTASELAEILDMQVGHQTNRTKTAQLHWKEEDPVPSFVWLNPMIFDRDLSPFTFLRFALWHFSLSSIPIVSWIGKKTKWRAVVLVGTVTAQADHKNSFRRTSKFSKMIGKDCGCLYIAFNLLMFISRK